LRPGHKWQGRRPIRVSPNRWKFNKILHSCRLGHKEQTYYLLHPPGTPRLAPRGPWRANIEYDQIWSRMISLESLRLVEFEFIKINYRRPCVWPPGGYTCNICHSVRAPGGQTQSLRFFAAPYNFWITL